MPLVFGFSGYGTFMNWRSKSRKVSFLDGFLGWVILVVFGFIGEFLAHAFRPESYRGIGDNPAMVAGLMITIMLSFIICPLAWWKLRRRAETKP